MMRLSFRPSDLYLIDKESLSMWLINIGMLIAFLGSLRAWFLWPLGNFYIVPAALLVITGMVVARSMDKDTIFTRSDYIVPLIALVLYFIYERISISSNVKGIIAQTLLIVIYYSLFQMDLGRLRQLVDFICRVMGVLLAISLAGHFLYLLGFPLPKRDVVYDEYYSFVNYYFFLLDDRNLFFIFPRFNSYFLEPSHIGQACAFLLMTQRGKWRRWYNIVMIATTALTFSVGAYIYLTAVIILNQWISQKQVVGKLIVVLLLLTAGTITTFTYNNGNNLVHDLIMLRLEIDDGELAGDNRVTDNFMVQYENFLESSDVLFGRQFEIVEFGNAGYRVFFYDHGIVGILLVFLFYVAAMINAPSKRAFIAVIVIAALYFWATAFMHSVYVFLSLYAAAYTCSDSYQKTNTVINTG